MRDIKPTHKPIKTFYAELKQYESLGATNETDIKMDKKSAKPRSRRNIAMNSTAMKSY